MYLSSVEFATSRFKCHIKISSHHVSFNIFIICFTVYNKSNSDREWMFFRILEDGFINPKFSDGVENFIAFPKRHPQCMDCEKLRCPCNHRKCQNKNSLMSLE